MVIDKSAQGDGILKNETNLKNNWSWKKDEVEEGAWQSNLQPKRSLLIIEGCGS